MKFYLALMFAGLFQVMAGNVVSQERVSLEMRNVTLMSLFKEIQKQTGISFVYNEDQCRDFGAVSVSVADKTVTEVLEKIFKNTPLVYRFEHGIIMVKAIEPGKIPQKTITVKGVVRDERGNLLPGVTIRIKGLNLGASSDRNGEFKLTIPEQENIALIVSFVGFRSQEVKIKDEKTLQIILEEEITAMDEVVIVSTGYQDIDRRKVTGAVTTLKMDDIKVAGLTSVDQMLEGHVPGMIFMQNSGQVGAAPKIRIRGTSTVLGNQEPLWVIDGIVQNDPVKISAADINNLDFVNLLGNAISGFNPDDVEQIDILKDAASTTIYGARAANGVIVITTKKGKVGPPRINYTLSGTVNRRPYYSDREINMMNSQERVDVSREMFERQLDFRDVGNWMGYEGAVLDYKAGRLTYQEFEKKAYDFETINTDWFKVLCKNSFSNKHTLSLDGGSQSARYYVSVGYSDDQGVIRGEMNRSYTTSMRLALNNEHLRMNFGVNGSVGNRKYTPTPGGTNIIQYAYQMNRALPAYNPDGSNFFYQRKSGVDYYPFNMRNEMKQSSNRIDNHNLAVNAQIRLMLKKGWSAETTLSYSIGNNNQETVYKEDTFYIAGLRKKGPGDSSSVCPWGGELTTINTRSSSYTARFQVMYSKELDKALKHNLTAMAGGEISSTKYHSQKETHRGYFPDRGKTFADFDGALLYQAGYASWRNWLAKNKPVISEDLTNILSGYFTAIYSYDDRYVFNFNVRADASNRFGQRSNEKFNPIWSVSGRWNAAKDLFPSSSVVNVLDLRLSFGYQGNMNDDQPSRMIIVKGSQNAIFNDYQSTVKYFPNPDLKWEKTGSYNATVDFSLFKRKVRGTVGYWYKRTEDAFLNKKVSEINGIQNYTINKGTLTNQGYELSLNFELINHKVNARGKQGFYWNCDPQIGQVLNKLINKAIRNTTNVLRDEVKYTDYLNGNVEISGKPLNTFYSYRFKGLSNENGSPLFYGLEPDLKDELHERYLAMTNEELILEVLEESGTRVPILQGSISNSLGYRNFSMRFTFSYSFGNKIRMLELCGTGYANIRPYPEKNLRREFTERWRKAGDEEKTNIPGLVSTYSVSQPWWNTSPYYSRSYTAAIGSDIYSMYDKSSIRVVRGDYLKLQALSVNYRFSESLCRKIGIYTASISLNGTNIFTLADKKLKGQSVSQSGSANTINLSLRPNYSLQFSMTF